MPMLIKLLGFSAALGALPALAFSALRAFTREDWGAWAHASVLLVATLLVVVMISGEPMIGRLLAVPLFLAAVGALAAEQGWRRVFPATLGIFALVVLDGGLQDLARF